MAICGRLDLPYCAQLLQSHEGILEIPRNVVLTWAENETAEDMSALLCSSLTIEIILGKITFSFKIGLAACVHMKKIPFHKVLQKSILFLKLLYGFWGCLFIEPQTGN